MINYPEELKPILQNLDKVYIVGGFVRDQLLGLKSKDIDIELYNTDYTTLANQLSKYGKVDLVGKSFGVIKLTLPSKETYDFSLARRDTKIQDQEGHKAFEVDTESNITEKEGASRRDLTINSLMYNPKTNEILDHFNGLEHLKQGILKHTSDKFIEDPLRALRIVQFASRFDFDVHPETIELCKSMSPSFNTLAKERIFEEFNKLLLKGTNTLKGFQVLSQIDWLKHFPELKALENLPQDYEFHPEGDVLVHTAHTCDAMKKLPAWQKLPNDEKLLYLYGILCHDLGKATTTFTQFKKSVNRDAIVSPGHDKEGVKPTISFLKSLKAPNHYITRVPSLVAHHMDHLQIKKDTQIRQLSVDLKHESIEGLSMVIEADHSGRPPLKAHMPEQMQYILNRARELNCNNSKPVPLIQGKDIQENTILQGGPIYGHICNKAYEAQIKGAFDTKEEALEWFKFNKSKIIENSKLGPERLVSGSELIDAGIKQDHNLGKLHRALYDAQIEGLIKTKKEAIKFITKNKDTYNIEINSIAKLKRTLQDIVIE